MPLTYWNGPGHPPEGRKKDTQNAKGFTVPPSISEGGIVIFFLDDGQTRQRRRWRIVMTVVVVLQTRCTCLPCSNQSEIPLPGDHKAAFMSSGQTKNTHVGGDNVGDAGTRKIRQSCTQNCDIFRRERKRKRKKHDSVGERSEPPVDPPS